MAVTSQEPSQENPTDRFPLLMERAQNNDHDEHIIDIERQVEASSMGLSNHESPRGLSAPHHEDRPSTSGAAPVVHSTSPPSNGSNSRNPTPPRRVEGFGRRWSPFNTLLWISLELVFTMGQIIAAIVVLCVSTDENPQTPLFAWIVGYAVGCAASLPLLYWRYLHRNRATDQRSSQLRQGSPRVNSTSEPSSYVTISLTRSSDVEDGQNSSTTLNGQSIRTANPRLSALIDHIKMALDCFFAVWFVVGNVWIFGGHSSASDAPNMYRLCIIFLTISCIGYAMPFILCAMICCCLPCLISVVGIREDMNGMRGASEECINALPTHKFKLKQAGIGSGGDSDLGLEEGGGLVAAGTEKERAISGEDAVCCICLAKYADNEELRELPCSHFFHTECVDKWLKINASCPLCKYEIDGGHGNSAVVSSSQQE